MKLSSIIVFFFFVFFLFHCNKEKKTGYFDTVETEYRVYGNIVFQHSLFNAQLMPKNYFLKNRKWYGVDIEPILPRHKVEDYKRSLKLNIKKLKDFPTSYRYIEYKNEYLDFEDEINIVKIFDFTIQVKDTLKYRDSRLNKILVDKKFEATHSDTIYYFLSQEGLEDGWEKTVKEGFFVSEKMGILGYFLLREQKKMEIINLQGDFFEYFFKNKNIVFENKILKETIKPPLNFYSNYNLEDIPIFVKRTWLDRFLE
ncbi:hypothetical protein [Runella zeae]|uniref:hypothetical protein n=1 Tax=Runella zeae TaxID=94255 RepID=UPI0004009670|nr:hypothetical protein [Runella zeae]